MDFIWITLGAWTAFAAAAFLPGMFYGQVARGCARTHA
jgi:hypothetical protein